MARERKKRYGWLLLLTILTYCLLLAMVLFVDPENVADLIIPGSYLLFALPFYIGLFLLLTIIFLSSKRALWWSSGLMIFLYLRVYGLGSFFNALLLAGILVCGELYVRFAKNPRNT